MQLVRREAAAPYDPPRHHGVEALRLQGGAVTDAFCAVGLSHFAPGGRAEMSASPEAKIYVVVDGQLTVVLGSGERTVLKALDSCLIEANEAREVRNEGDVASSLLVLTPA